MAPYQRTMPVTRRSKSASTPTNSPDDGSIDRHGRIGVGGRPGCESHARAPRRPSSSELALAWNKLPASRVRRRSRSRRCDLRTTIPCLPVWRLRARRPNRVNLRAFRDNRGRTPPQRPSPECRWSVGRKLLAPAVSESARSRLASTCGSARLNLPIRSSAPVWSFWTDFCCRAQKVVQSLFDFLEAAELGGEAPAISDLG